MASKDFSDEEGGEGEKEKSHNNGKAKKKRTIKERHKFAKEELQELHMVFKQNPYPDHTTREELATKFNCEVHVIRNWFQNYRTRLSPEEKHRLHNLWRKQNCLPPCLNYKGTQNVASNDITKQGFFGTQKAPIKGAGCSALDKQRSASQHMYFSWHSVRKQRSEPQVCYEYTSLEEQEVPSQQMHSYFSSVQKQGLHSPDPYSGLPSPEKQEIPDQEVCFNTFTVASPGEQPGRDLVYPDDTESGYFPAYYPSYSLRGYFFPFTPVQCFDKERPKARKTQQGSPFLEHKARRQGEQTEEHPLASPEQPQNWQHDWQQPYDDGQQIVFLQQLPMDQSQRDLGQQLPLSQNQLQGQFPQTPRMPKSSQLQPEPPQGADSSPSPARGRHVQQGTLAQPRARTQQLCEERPVSVHFPHQGTQPQEEVLGRSAQSHPHGSSG